MMAEDPRRVGSFGRNMEWKSKKRLLGLVNFAAAHGMGKVFFCRAPKGRRVSSPNFIIIIYLHTELRIRKLKDRVF